MFTGVRMPKLLAAALLLSALCVPQVHAAPVDFSFPVTLRGTGSATIHASIYNNPANRGATTILAVHGFTERATMFEPLANAIFADSILKGAVKRIISIDLVGHGTSSNPTLPAPTKYADLLIEDNISVVIQSIDKLRAANMGPQVIMGHSMGGLAIQGAQEALLASNSSLKQKGVLGAILIAAVPNRNVAWTHTPTDPTAPPNPFVVDDPTLGRILDVPPAAARSTGGFTRLSDGAIPANVPPVEVFIANDWSSPEPISTAVELTGVVGNPDTRPACRQNAFSQQNGTILSVLSFSQDALARAAEQPALYTFLTGKPSTGSTTLYRPIVADDAVHSMYISNPAGLIAALKNGVF
jgi:pimeloyl-ACP methyl ester carboxylesterase